MPVLVPIPASAESKSRLRAFQFKAPDTMQLGDESLKVVENSKEAMNTAEENKENGEREYSHLQKKPPLAQTSRHPSLSQQSSNKDIRDCPQTPVGRIPLADLIAAEVDSNQQSLNLTPVERVTWRHSQQSGGQNDHLGKRTAKRGKKRAYSSSPSSSQNEKSRRFSADSPPSDLDSLIKSLKTPQVDPAEDLWSRYSLNSVNKPSPTGAIRPAITNLLPSSSPQTPVKHLSVGESSRLRRSYSCNIEWPTSVAKRRKVHDNYNNRESNICFPDTLNDEKANSKMARVSLLVDAVQDSLVRPCKSQESRGLGLSLSSSTSQKHAPPRVAESRTLHSQADRGSDGRLLKYRPDGDTKPLEQRSNDNDQCSLDKSSEGSLAESFDFDDDDLDIELLKRVEEVGKIAPPSQISATAPAFLHDLNNKSFQLRNKQLNPDMPDMITNDKKEIMTPLIVNKAKSKSFSSSAPLERNDSSSPWPAKMEVILNGDEFYEDDNDVSVADLEDVMAIYDVKPQCRAQSSSIPCDREGGHGLSQKSLKALSFSSNNQETQRDGGTVRFEEASDDEFGGDVDFERIVAQCEEATQKSQSDSVSQPLVRTTVFDPSM